MKSKLIEEQPRTYVLIFETGDEISGELKAFAKQNQLRGSSFKAIGALSHARWAGLTGKRKNMRLQPNGMSSWKCFR